MKKILLIIIGVLLLLASCSTKEVKKEDKDKEIIYIVEKRDIENNIDFKYPEIRGMEDKEIQNKINEEFKKVVYGENYDQKNPISEEENLSYWSSYEVSYAKGNILSVIYNLSLYEKGAAHPNNLTYGMTVNVSNGKVYNLTDLFKENSDYKKIINKKLKEEVEKIDFQLFKPFEGLEENQIFYLTDEGIVFVYQPYIYTPHAYGPLKILVKYKDIKNELKIEL